MKWGLNIEIVEIGFDVEFILIIYGNILSLQKIIFAENNFI